MDSKVTLYWEKEMPNGTVRYYRAELTTDLFDTVVFCIWGTKGTKRGGTKTYPMECDKNAHELMMEISKKRKQRGYLLKTLNKA